MKFKKPKPHPITFTDDLEKFKADAAFLINQQEFHVHKQVLACKSQIFKWLFYGRCKEIRREILKDVYKDGQKVVISIRGREMFQDLSISSGDKMELYDITNISSEILKGILEIVYTGRMSTEDNILRYPDSHLYTDCENEEILSNNKNRFVPELAINDLEIFWDNAEELLKVATTLDVLGPVKTFLSGAFTNYICQNSNCIYCLNSQIFAKVHEFSIYIRTFTRTLVNVWIQALWHHLPSPPTGPGHASNNFYREYLHRMVQGPTDPKKEKEAQPKDQSQKVNCSVDY